VEIPVIETPRLRLRGHRLSDFPDCAAMWADAGVTRFLGGKPLSAEDAWAKFLRYAGHWTMKGFGFWAIEEKDSGAYAGELGFADFRREIQPPLGDDPEAGWVLAPGAHGRGYATEALRAATGWIDESLRVLRTVCIISPENAQSVRVAEKCGYRQERRSEYKAHPVVVFARPNGASSNVR
jgi:RimJ/RimL family protein N-acetyltransferase